MPTRRQFLASTAAAATLAAGCTHKEGPDIIKPSAIGKANQLPPSERTTMAMIGIGNQGSGHLNNWVKYDEAQMLAVCDVRREVRERSKQRIEEAYETKFGTGGYHGIDMYTDFRELLSKRNDIDAVLIAVPEHWHAIIAIVAARAGKDIYCEKPLAHTIREADAMVRAVRRYGRVFQTGSQQRSDDRFRFACELVRNGRIGKLEAIYIGGVYGTSHWGFLPEQPIPSGLDWDFWQGPAPERPYNDERASGSYTGGWRLIREYSGGMMCDWGAHHFDIAQWGLGMDGSGPVKVNPPDGRDHPVLTYTYANGVKLMHWWGDGTKQLKTPTGKPPDGVLFAGTDGWVQVNRGKFATGPDEIGKTPLAASELHLYKSPNHHLDFLKCVRTRQKPICDVEIGATSVTVCHLGNIAYWLDREIKWDPAKREITGDEQASRMLDTPKRDPWRMEA
jgi:predicted dehydrogenase